MSAAHFNTTIKTLAILIVINLAYATTSAQALDTNSTKLIKASLAKLKINTAEIEIEPSKIEGISEVTLGLQVMYITNDGKYVLGGPMISTHDGKNISNLTVATARKKVLENTNVDSEFQYQSDDAIHQVTVVTDIDCPHCRRLHNEIPKLQTKGISVNYVLLPRAGKDSPSYEKTVSAACAPMPEDAITSAMAGKPAAPNTCEHPIDKHMKLARDLNITSTPAIIFEDGHLELGYKSADRLVELLDSHFE